MDIYVLRELIDHATYNYMDSDDNQYYEFTEGDTFNLEINNYIKIMMLQYYKIMKQYINSYSMLIKNTFIKKDQCVSYFFNKYRNKIIYNKKHATHTIIIENKNGIINRLLRNYADVFYKYYIVNYAYKKKINDQIKQKPEPETEPDNACPICLDDIKKTPKWLIKCLTCKNSLYHLSCISECWKINKACPICRREHNTKNKDYIFVHKDNMLKYINVKQNDEFIEE